jgi:formate-dependent nitrite reductase membrane component NrfD
MSADAAGTRSDRADLAASGEMGVRTYHGRPVLKEPAWTWEVPWYLFFGGLAGASSMLAAGATLTGRRELARRARLAGAVGAGVSTPLLVADLGRPTRFLNMLRVFKPTSVMSMGSWILASYSGAASVSAGLAEFDRLPRLRAVADAGAGVLGAGMLTYTGALVADTAIPVWHEARHELPALFAGSGLASAGAAATLLTPPVHAGPARRVAVTGAVAELAIDAAMRRRLGEIGEVYEREEAGRFHRAAAAATATGAALVAAGGARRRWLTAAGSVTLLAGSVCQRWAVYRAGFQSARDPAATIGPQRRRLRRGEGHRRG